MFVKEVFDRYIKSVSDSIDSKYEDIKENIESSKYNKIYRIGKKITRIYEKYKDSLDQDDKYKYEPVGDLPEEVYPNQDLRMSITFLRGDYSNQYVFNLDELKEVSPYIEALIDVVSDEINGYDPDEKLKEVMGLDESEKKKYDVDKLEEAMSIDEESYETNREERKKILNQLENIENKYNVERSKARSIRDVLENIKRKKNDVTSFYEAIQWFDRNDCMEKIKSQRVSDGFEESCKRYMNVITSDEHHNEK